MRLDQVLVEFFEIESRTKAQALIADGKIRVDGKIIDKPSFKIADDQHDKIEILDSDVLRYVSRAGIKLEKAIARLGIDMRTKQVLDIGQSTGGFTDCVLQHGARRVVGIDVGHRYWRRNGEEFVSQVECSVRICTREAKHLGAIPRIEHVNTSAS